MEIPIQSLAPEILSAIIEEFVTREGTDYGPKEYTLEQKIERVKAQLEAGVAVIVFDPKSETCDIVPTYELARKKAAGK